MTVIVAQVLQELGIKEWKLEYEPLNEEDFNRCFHKVVGVDNNNHAILSNDPKDFGVTWDQIVQAKQQLEQEIKANKHKDLRKQEYPSIGDQLDALFHAGVFPPEMAAQIQAVKDKYPKGS